MAAAGARQRLDEVGVLVAVETLGGVALAAVHLPHLEADLLLTEAQVLRRHKTRQEDVDPLPSGDRNSSSARPLRCFRFFSSTTLLHDCASS